MTCSATTKTCQCPNAGEKWCSAANSGTGGCVEVNPIAILGTGATCCFNTQCFTELCSGNKCTACPAGKPELPALQAQFAGLGHAVGATAARHVGCVLSVTASAPHC